MRITLAQNAILQFITFKRTIISLLIILCLENIPSCVSQFKVINAGREFSLGCIEWKESKEKINSSALTHFKKAIEYEPKYSFIMENFVKANWPGSGLSLTEVEKYQAQQVIANSCGDYSYNK